MKQAFLLIAIVLLSLSACSGPQVINSTATLPIQVGATETPTPTVTFIPIETPAAPLPTATQPPRVHERPVFLSWPLPAYIGLARISQYPNSAWTWNYLGLNPGFECPPMFGYLLNVDSWPYWRDVAIPEEQDKTQADPHNFEMVECYSTSAGGPSGHEGTDIKAPAGTPVYAAADGLIQEWRDAGLNSMIVLKHCISGTWDAVFQCVGRQQWYTTYMHLIPNPALLKENQAVAQGDSLGTVYDQSINSHLHFEVGHEKRSYTNFVNPWGQDSAPWLGCLWQNQALCANPYPAFKRLAVYTTGKFSIELGDGSRITIQNAPALKQIRLWGERMAALDFQGNLFIWDGKYIGSQADNFFTWQKVAENVLNFQVADERAAIIDQNRNLLVKEHALDGEWVLQAANVRAFSLADTRLGYLNDQGDLFIKTGSLENNWQLVKNKVLAFQVVDNRIAFVDEQRKLYVNEGEAQSEYQPMASDVQGFQVANARLGVINTDGNLLVKEGNLRAGWVLQAEHVRSFQLAGLRVLMCGEDGMVKFKEGSLYQPWTNLPYGASIDVFLNGEMPAYVYVR